MSEQSGAGLKTRRTLTPVHIYLHLHPVSSPSLGEAAMLIALLEDGSGVSRSNLEPLTS